MDAEEALAIVASKAAGRTRYEGQEPYLDEVLAAEVRRLRALVATDIGDMLMEHRAKISVPAAGADEGEQS